jgi:tetratricopeptide (TPR) repeat protein
VAYVNAGHEELFFDSVVMADRPEIQDVSSALRRLWRSPLRPGEELTYITFAANYAVNESLGLSGFDVTGFLVVNVFVHALNACLVYVLLRALLQANDPDRRTPVVLPLALSVLFAVHPLHASSVVYLMQRRGLMAATFYLAGLLTYLRFRATRRLSFRLALLAAVILCYWLSFKSKSMGLTLPLAILALEFCLRAADRRAVKRFLLWLAAGALLCVLGLFFFLWTQNLFELKGLRIRPLGNIELWGAWPHFLTESRVFWHYWKLILVSLPQWLCIDHEFSLSHHLWQHGAWVAVVFHVLLIGTAFAAATKRYAIGAFGVLLFYIALIPWAILPQRELFVEYKTYLSAIGAVLVLAELVRRWRSTFVLPIVAMAAMALLVTTVRRNAVYQSELTVWADAIEKYPDNPRAHANLGVALRAIGKTDQAIQHYREALRIEPRSCNALINLGNALRQQGKLDEAVEKYRLAVETSPNNPDAQLMLGTAYYEQNKLDDAVRQYQEALRIKPAFAHAHYCLGLALEAQGRADQAIGEYSAVLAIQPNHAEAQKAMKMAQEGLPRLTNSTQPTETP